MDKRITELKNLIILENIWKIKKLNEKGFIDFDIEEKIIFHDSLKDFYLTRLICHGPTISQISTNQYTGVQECYDIRLINLEDIDYNVTCLLDSEIEKRNSFKDKYSMN